MGPQGTRITILGTAAAVPAAHQDTASFLINREILFDCGWYAALKMLQYGDDPLRVRILFFTHCHHDHYMGLPALLFYRGMRAPRAGEELPPLEIVGPPDDLPVVVEAARRFLQADRFPNVWPPVSLHPLTAGETYETDAFRIETVRALHPVTGVCGRFEDKRTGVVIAFSGDTAPNAALGTLAKGADLLLHEASVHPDAPLRGDHSRGSDAARTAVEAGVHRLRLVHVPERYREASLAAAQAIFPAARLAEEGETLILRVPEA